MRNSDQPNGNSGLQKPETAIVPKVFHLLMVVLDSDSCVDVHQCRYQLLLHDGHLPGDNQLRYMPEFGKPSLSHFIGHRRLIENQFHGAQSTFRHATTT